MLWRDRLFVMTRIAVIGGGRIGEALVSGLLVSDWKARDLVIAEKLETRARQLTTDYGVRVTDNLRDAVEGADVVVIAVKPGDVDAMLTELSVIQENSDDDLLLVSLVAGIPTSKMENLLIAGTAVVRVMPNTPMLVGKGASAVCGGRYATPAQLELVEQMLGAVGTVRRVKEAQMDAVTAVSGSGPAYVFLAVEAMIDSGVALGLTRTIAADLAVQTFVGASAMLSESGESPVELRAAVTSPGGATAAGVRVLESEGLRSAFYEAMAAVRDRSAELGKIVD